MTNRRPVLVVENDLVAQTALLALLHGDGYEAQVVTNGTEALDWLRGRREDPCAIFLPASMAAGGGKEFLERLEREFPRLFSSLPILFARGPTNAGIGQSAAFSRPGVSATNGHKGDFHAPSNEGTRLS